MEAERVEGGVDGRGRTGCGDGGGAVCSVSNVLRGRCNSEPAVIVRDPARLKRDG